MASNYTLDTLLADLKNSAYVPKTQAELTEAANRRYQAAYDQKRLEAQQAADMNQLALDKQLSSLGTAYARQKEAAAQSYAQAYSQANRQATSRGMQRSSFNNANLSGIAVAGNKAQQEIADNEALTRTGLEDQKTLLAQQLSQQLTQLGAAQTADTLSYLDQLESQEYDRQAAAGDRQNSLNMQIYQFAAQKDAQDTAAAQWQKEYDESLRQYNESLAEQVRQYNASLQQQQNQATLDEQYRQNQYGENQRQFELSLAQQQKQLEEEMRQFDILHPKKSGGGKKNPPPPPPPPVYSSINLNLGQAISDFWSLLFDGSKTTPKTVDPKIVEPRY